jgi:DNA-binding Lrp family transcriptional regulator
MMRSKTLEAVVRDLEEREAVGIQTYGCTVDRADLQTRDWMRHAYQEALDLAMYLRRAQEEATDDGNGAVDAGGIDRDRGVDGFVRWQPLGSRLTVSLPPDLVAGGSQVAVYCALASMASPDGTVDAGIRSIATMVDMSPVTVSRLLGNLVHDGYIERLDGDHPNSRARYRLR